MSVGLSASETRLVRFLKQGGCEMQDSVRETHVLLVGEQGTIAATRFEIGEMQKRGVIICDGQRTALSGPIRKVAAKCVKPAKTARVSQTIETEQGRLLKLIQPNLRSQSFIALEVPMVAASFLRTSFGQASA